MTLHAQLEEEIFYPALREGMDEADLVDEAQVEHDSAKTLITQISGMIAGEPRFDALVTVLGEYVRHHVQEEEGEIFRKVKRAKIDTAALGERIAQRKAQLQGGGADAAGGTEQPLAGALDMLAGFDAVLAGDDTQQSGNGS